MSRSITGWRRLAFWERTTGWNWSNGELVEMAPIGSRHLACVVVLNHLLVETSEGRWFVSVQKPGEVGRA